MKGRSAMREKKKRNRATRENEQIRRCRNNNNRKKRTAGKWEGGGGKIKRGSASSSIKARHIRFICLENSSPLIKSCYTLHRKSTTQLNMQTKEPLALFFVCVCVFSETFRTLRSKLFLLFSSLFFFFSSLPFLFEFLFYGKHPHKEREREAETCVKFY